jgi:hypothetical protein
MRLGSRRARSRDGQLVLVTPDLRRALPVEEIAPTLQDALDRWTEVEQTLGSMDTRFAQGGEALPRGFRSGGRDDHGGTQPAELGSAGKADSPAAPGDQRDATGQRAI